MPEGLRGRESSRGRGVRRDRRRCLGPRMRRGWGGRPTRPGRDGRRTIPDRRLRRDEDGSRHPARGGLRDRRIHLAPGGSRSVRRSGRTGHPSGDRLRAADVRRAAGEATIRAPAAPTGLPWAVHRVPPRNALRSRIRNGGRRHPGRRATHRRRMDDARRSTVGRRHGVRDGRRSRTTGLPRRRWRDADRHRGTDANRPRTDADRRHGTDATRPRTDAGHHRDRDANRSSAPAAGRRCARDGSPHHRTGVDRHRGTDANRPIAAVDGHRPDRVASRHPTGVDGRQLEADDGHRLQKKAGGPRDRPGGREDRRHRDADRGRRRRRGRVDGRDRRCRHARHRCRALPWSGRSADRRSRS